MKKFPHLVIHSAANETNSRIEINMLRKAQAH